MAQDPETALAMVHPDDLPGMRAALALAAATGKSEAEYRQFTKSGDYRWISNRISVTRDAVGRSLFRDGNIRDVTERKAVEAEREMLLHELDGKNQELQSQNEELLAQGEALKRGCWTCRGSSPGGYSWTRGRWTCGRWRRTP